MTGESNVESAASTEPRMSAGSAAPRKTRVVLRILAVLAIIVLAIFCGGAISGAADNTAHPSCADVRAGRAQLPASGTCFENAEWQATAGLVLAGIAGAAVALALLVSLVLLIRGNRGGLFLRLAGGGLLFLGLSLLITKA
jgi:hypothetical protein